VQSRFFAELGTVDCYWYHNSWQALRRFMVPKFELPDPGWLIVATVLPPTYTFIAEAVESNAVAACEPVESAVVSSDCWRPCRSPNASFIRPNARVFLGNESLIHTITHTKSEMLAKMRSADRCIQTLTGGICGAIIRSEKYCVMWKFFLTCPARLTSSRSAFWR
jgi:hypothetical protein